VGAAELDSPAQYFLVDGRLAVVTKKKTSKRSKVREFHSMFLRTHNLMVIPSIFKNKTI